MEVRYFHYENCQTLTKQINKETNKKERHSFLLDQKNQHHEHVEALPEANCINNATLDKVAAAFFIGL